MGFWIVPDHSSMSARRQSDISDHYLWTLARFESCDCILVQTTDCCVIDFDMYAPADLVSPAEIPVKKRTRIMSNSGSLLSALKDKQCDRSHEHRPIEGSEIQKWDMLKWC